jgi:hypothetical protein
MIARCPKANLIVSTDRTHAPERIAGERVAQRNLSSLAAAVSSFASVPPGQS